MLVNNNNLAGAYTFYTSLSQVQKSSLINVMTKKKY